MSRPFRFRWNEYIRAVEALDPVRTYGRVSQVIGLIVEGEGPIAAIGDTCWIRVPHESSPITAEVVGFKDNKILLMPLGELRGIEPGCQIIPEGAPPRVRLGPRLLGRVLDGLGRPIDEQGPIPSDGEYPLYGQPVNPVTKQRISQPIDVGIKAVNALLTVGKGQRIAIFSGSGVGKSTLLGMMARHTSASVSVIALIGERSREVREFIEKDLGEEGLKRSVVVVATSDQAPLVRMRGAYLATTVAEYFRDAGKDVLLMMDSVTRYAMASREVGLSIGEPPTSKGYTPGVFAQLPRLLERVGTTSGGGSITGIYTVLIEADDLNDPIGDAVRSISDGHINLSRDLANQGHYPAIDVLGSVSRVMDDIVDPEQMKARSKLVSLVATYRKAEDLINIGAYVKGNNPQIDEAIRKFPEITDFLQQNMQERVSLAESVKRLKALFSGKPGGA